MKKIIPACLLCLLCAHTFAQKENNDSLAYQLQRAKINQMLDVRTQKFGQYDKSLSEHTGIFGLQTKKDIRRSNDILMDISKTDDSIFKEIKILMDYRVFQQQQAQSHSTEADRVNLGFMGTINRLRQQIDKLNHDAQKEKEHQQKLMRTFIIIIVLMLGSILLLLIRKRAAKA
jgi:hypothetical protein